MANKQVDGLTEKTTPVDADLIPIWDSEEGGAEALKKMSFANLIGYEEGTWTPVPADAESGGNTGSAATALGTYTKIGRIVTITCHLIDIDITGLTGGNSMFIQGLPFTAQSAVGVTYVGSPLAANVTFSDSIVTIIANNTDVMRFTHMTTGSAAGGITVSDFSDDTADLIVTMQYEV